MQPLLAVSTPNIGDAHSTLIDCFVTGVRAGFEGFRSTFSRHRPPQPVWLDVGDQPQQDNRSAGPEQFLRMPIQWGGCYDFLGTNSLYAPVFLARGALH